MLVVRLEQQCRRVPLQQSQWSRGVWSCSAKTTYLRHYLRTAGASLRFVVARSFSTRTTSESSGRIRCQEVQQGVPRGVQLVGLVSRKGEVG